MKLTITRYTVCSDKFDKQFAGCRIVVLSDLHDTVFGEDNCDLFERVNNEKPDIVIIAGDLVTAKKGRDFSPALKLLNKLASKWQVYYGLGNHEKRPREEIAAYMQDVRKISGVHVLDNESAFIDSFGIRITGLSLPGRFYQKGKRVLAKASDIYEEVGDKTKEFTVLIAHNPNYFKAYAEWGAELVLSGHLHGGIVRLPLIGGIFSPQISFFPKYDKGMFKQGETSMVVSAGLGKHTIPIRLWNPAELVVIDLKNNFIKVAKNHMI